MITTTILIFNVLIISGTPDICEKMLDEAIDNIPISTRKRKLFDNKPPLTDSSNIPSVSTYNPFAFYFK